MIATSMLNIVVTVFIVGQPPISERLTTDFPVTTNACHDAAKAIEGLKREGITIKAECVPVAGRKA